MKHKQHAIGILVIIWLVWAVPNASGASTPVMQETALALPDWQPVNNPPGFGDPLAGKATEVTALEAFNGYLYVATHNPIEPEPLYDGAQIFRSSDGLTWTPVNEQPGFGNTHDTAPPAILDLTVFKGYIYASTGRGNAAQIWRSLDGENWGPVVNAGFGDPDIVDLTVMAEFDGWLYVGARKQDYEAQIWRTYTGDGNLNNWTRVAVSTDPARVTGLAVFNVDAGLYAAVESETGAPAQIWYTYGSGWTVSDGFGDSNTLSTGGMAEYAGYLYVGAGNTTVGAQLWRTDDGATWESVTSPAFEAPGNQKVEAVFVYENQLYVSVKNTVTGMEIWRSTDGTLWEQASLDGFGNPHNTGTNGSNAVADFGFALYVGTLNVTDGGELWCMRQPSYSYLYLPLILR